MPDQDNAERQYITDAQHNLREIARDASRRFGRRRRDAIDALVQVADEVLVNHHAAWGGFCCECDEPFPCRTYAAAARVLSPRHESNVQPAG